MQSSRLFVRVAVASLVVCAGRAALGVDYHIPLSYNWNGMYHFGEEGQPDSPDGFRSISDRALSIDGGANSFGTNPIVGATGVTYTRVDTAFTLDIVHLGNTGAGNAKTWDTVVDGDNLGVQPNWLPDPSAHTQPQVTTLASPILLDANSSIGVLYQVSNNGGQFDMVLGFTDSTTVTVTFRGADWFGPTNPPAALPGVASQTRLNGTTFQGTSNGDSPIVQTWPTQALAVTEGVVTVASISGAGLGNIAGKSLSTISFQNPVLTTKGYAILSATVVSGLGPPQNDDCANAQVVAAGETVTESLRATGATTSACGIGDTADVWYRFTPTASGLVEARTCGAGFDSTISVFSGSCAGAAVACNDNGCGLASRVQWNATAGTPYLIRVAGNGGATGTFTLAVQEGATAHTDVPLPLAYNWNGLVHSAGGQEGGNADAPMGYRSIADRGLVVDGAPGSLDAGLVTGTDFIRYNIGAVANDVDCIALVNRTFNTFAGDFIGNTPGWLAGGSGNIPGPVATSLTGLNLFMGPATRFGFLYQMTNGGGSFDVTLEFGDGSSITTQLYAPDWYLDQQPAPPFLPMEVQRQHGVYNASRDTDVAVLNAPALNVVEAVFSTSSLLSAGLGDINGRRLTGISFGNRVPTGAAVAVLAATVRDSVPPTGPVPPAGSGSATPGSAQITGTVLLRVATSPGFNPASTGITVTGNLSAINGSSSQTFYDNGTNGDVTAGDGVFSYLATLNEPMSAGPVSVGFTVADAQGRSSGGTINFNATAAPTGQCCVGGGCQILTAYNCSTGGGVYGGNGTNCAGNASTPFASGDSFPMAIPDFAGGVPGSASSTVFVSGGGTITNLAVRVGLTHTFMGDLIGTLSNGSTTVTLFNRIGGGNDPNGEYVFHDLAPATFASAVGTNPIPGGDYSAGESFGAFTGQPLDGTWTLTITDNAGIDTGSILSFSVGQAVPANCGPVCGTADFDGDGDTGTDADIEAFFACLAGSCCGTCWHLGADFNADGDVGTDADIEAFFRVLAGNNC